MQKDGCKMENINENQIIRTKMLIGDTAVEKLDKANVLVVGLGGVGSFCVEALARAGVGKLTICDHDTIAVSNLNRQLCALNSTIGKYKADVMLERAKDINENIKIIAIKEYYTKENRDLIFNADYDYIIDAIDSVTSKIDLIVTAKQKNIPIISAMGTGNKLDPEKFEITDISKTTVCPLARVMRKELKNRGIYKHTVVFSSETPKKPNNLEEIPQGKGNVPSSISFVPPVAGFLMVSHVIKKIIEEK